MVNVVDAISGGSNELVHERKRQRKDYLLALNHVCKGKHFITPWYHIPITFTISNLKLKHFSHNDPLVIRVNIGKNLVHFFGNDMGRIIVDTGSSADVITWRCFVQMDFTEKNLKSVYPLTAFRGDKWGRRR